MDTRALLQLQKNQLEITITDVDQQAVTLALKATLLELAGPNAAEVYARHHTAEKNRLSARRDELQSGAETLQTIIERLPNPNGPIQ
jgi:hypothetical protein